MPHLHLAHRARLVLLVALVVTALTAVLRGQRDALAAPLADEELVGVTSDLATFKLGIPKGDDRVAYIEIGEPAGAFPFPCFGAGTLAPDGLQFGRVGLTGAQDFAITDPATGEARALRLTGRMIREGIATGDLSISGEANAEGIVCSPRSFSWAVVARSSSDAPVAGAKYTGTLLAGQTYGGLVDNAGAVSLRTSAAGDAITNYLLQPEQSCAATDLGTLSSPLKAGGISIVEFRPRSDSVAQARHRISLFGRSGVGAFYIDHDKPGCRGLAGVFVLQASAAPSATPTPPAATTPTAAAITPPLPAPTPIAAATVATPAASAPTPAAATVTAPGTFAAPPVFPTSGPRLAQAVFRGGSLSELDTALRGVNATGVWAQSSDGTFLLYVVGAPAFVNERFLRAFPAGFGGTTALTVVGVQATPTFGRPE